MKQPVFLINLDRQPGRLSFMQGQLGNLGISPVRIAAVDGKKPNTLKSAAVAPYSNMTKSEVACFESHRYAWTKIVEDNLGGAIIIEDDVLVSSDFSELNFSDDRFNDIDLIKLDQSKGQISHYGSKEITVSNDRSVVRFLGTEISTGAYYISRKGAAALIQSTQNYILPVDTILFDSQSKLFWQLNVWKLKSAAAVQLHMVVGQHQLTGDYAERIQTSTQPNSPPKKPNRFMQGFRKVAIAIHRLASNDRKTQRIKRAEQNTAIIAKQESVNSSEIPFYTANDSHYTDIISQVRKA